MWQWQQLVISEPGGVETGETVSPNTSKPAVVAHTPLRPAWCTERRKHTQTKAFEELKLKLSYDCHSHRYTCVGSWPAAKRGSVKD